MTYEQLVQLYREDFNNSIDDYVKLAGESADIACAFAAGVLQIVSAMYLKHDDISEVNIKAMREAMIDIGAARGWGVARGGAQA